MTEESAGEATAAADQAIGLIVDELAQLQLAIHEYRPDSESAHRIGDRFDVSHRLVRILKAVDILRSQTDSHLHDIYEPGREVVALLMSVEQELTRQGVSDVVAAGRLVELEWRAVEAEVVLARLRNRRLVRLLNVFAGWLRRPWRLGEAWKRFRSALVALDLPDLPTEKPSAASYLSSLVRPAPSPRRRPFVYPHLRVVHAGRLNMFQAVTPLLPVDAEDLDAGLETGYDLLLVEPGVDDPLDELSSETVTRFTEAGIPIVVVARTLGHLDLPITSQVSVVVVEDPDIADHAAKRQLPTLQIDPSVDDIAHNPIGWQRQPAHSLLMIADHHRAGSDITTLAPLSDQLSLLGASIRQLDSGPPKPRPVGVEQADIAKQHVAAYTSPNLAATPTAHIQLALELVAAGTPVIAPPNPALDALLPGHYLPAADTTQISEHLETLQHPPNRERHSVPARRHVLTNHTRLHRFEQLLTTLEIPTNPTPKISILLSTNRPENVDHALTNITNQIWPDKELLLILHDHEQFDINHIQTLTQTLPYPTTIIPAPKQWTLGDCLNAGLGQATGEYITKMDDDDHYGPHHLTDVHTALTYSNADITGKFANIVYLEQRGLTMDWLIEKDEAFGTHLPGATILIERDLLSRYRFARVNQGEDSALHRTLMADGRRLYSTHRFNFIRVRHGSHAYQRGDESFLSVSSGDFRHGLDLEHSML